MGRPRAFDWDEAKRLRAQGLTYKEIGEHLGVSSHAAMCACNEKVRRKQRALSRKLIEDRKEPCRGGCGVLIHAHYGESREISGYCRDCLSERRRFEAEMRHSHGTESRYVNLGCRCPLCREAASQARRRRRERSRVPCSHGCGRMVDSTGRRNPSKPPECRPCSHARVIAERRAARAAQGVCAVA